MLITLYLILQVIYFIWFSHLFRHKGLGFFTLYYLVMSGLLIFPFFLIAFHATGVIDLVEWVGRAPNERIVLSLGDGARPLGILMLFQLAYLGGGSLATQSLLTLPFRGLVQRIGGWDVNEARRYTWLGLAIFGVAVVYTVARYVVVPDFPLFSLLKGAGDSALRDVAFGYLTRASVPYIFDPSINSQFYRIFMPLATLMLLVAYRQAKGEHGEGRILLVCFWVMLSVSLAMNLGTLKRTPVLYLMMWYVAFRYMYQPPRVLLRIAWVMAPTVVVLLLITGAYGSYTLGETLANLTSRAFVGEAVVEYVALEHFGTSLDFLYLQIPVNHILSVLGQDVMTFSEMWKKITVPDGRGFSAVGIMAELYASFGILASFFFYIAWGWLLGSVDALLRGRLSEWAKPFVAGLMMVCAFMSVKGFFPQMFAGGALSLVALTVMASLYFRERTSEAWRLEKGLVP